MIKRISAAALLAAAGQLVFAASVPAVPDGLKVIYSTLNDDRDKAYDCCTGLALNNSPSSREQQFIAMPFTPAEDGHVRRVDLAITWTGGANRVSISLRADAGGVPGDVIKQAGESDFPVSGTCCELKAVSTGRIAVQGGVRYWIVARPTADMWGAWNDNTIGATGDFAFKQNEGWVAWNGSLGAFAVLGD